MYVALVLLLQLSHIFGLTVLLAQSGGAEQAARNTKPKWHVATYRGLVMGKSTRADMLRIFGKPVWSGAPEGQTKADPNPVVWNSYDGGGEFPGRVTLEVDKHSGVIQSIMFSPDELRRAQLIQHFGEGYIITKYDFDECLGRGGAAPIFESPNGSVEFLEYRERGIAVSIEHDGYVSSIEYVSAPRGAAESKCKAKSRGKLKPKRKA